MAHATHHLIMASKFGWRDLRLRYARKFKWILMFSLVLFILFPVLHRYSSTVARYPLFLNRRYRLKLLSTEKCRLKCIHCALFLLAIPNCTKRDESRAKKNTKWNKTVQSSSFPQFRSFSTVSKSKQEQKPISQNTVCCAPAEPPDKTRMTSKKKSTEEKERNKESV